MGIPLSEVSKFNVKGEVLIYKRDKTIETIPLAEAIGITNVPNAGIAANSPPNWQISLAAGWVQMLPLLWFCAPLKGSRFGENSRPAAMWK
jgi:hypothetical protein